MKKSLILVALLAVSVMAFGVVGSAYAQGGPPNPGGYGPGDGAMHELMEASLADQLGISVAELETRHEAGETTYQIALDLGFSADEATSLILAAHTAALKQAVAEGLITQEQADWMLSRQSRMGSGTGFGAGDCDGTGMYNQGSMPHGGYRR